MFFEHSIRIPSQTRKSAGYEKILLKIMVRTNKLAHVVCKFQSYFHIKRLVRLVTTLL